MKRSTPRSGRIPLGQAGKATRGLGGADIEMGGLWHKAGLTR